MATTEKMEFDPLAVENVGVTLAVELLQQQPNKVPPTAEFKGAGIYALYYSGQHEAYRSLVGLDAGKLKYPVYIGKAAGQNAKQGFNPHGTNHKTLFNRIRHHAKSIIQAENLILEDFSCRFLVLNDAYINLAESVMIRVFRPPWNGMGFGSNATGKPRMAGKPSLWDSLHPGREGRPEGYEERAKEASTLIETRIGELGAPASDPAVKRMYERIMTFV